MRVVWIVILGALSAFWFYGLIDQINSTKGPANYLAGSGLLTIVGLWNWLGSPK